MRQKDHIENRLILFAHRFLSVPRLETSLPFYSLEDDALTSDSRSDSGLFYIVSCFFHIYTHTLVSTLLYPQNSFFCLPGVLIYSVCWTFVAHMHTSLFFSLHPPRNCTIWLLCSFAQYECFIVHLNVYADRFPIRFGINIHYMLVADYFLFSFLLLFSLHM